MALTRFEDVADVTTEDYFNGNQMCINVFYSKYTHFLQEEERRETPPEVFKRNARELARFESDPKYEEMWFDLMYNDWFRPGGSILSGLGSGRNESLLNCTTLPIKGDSLEDISEAEYSLMKCAAYRQGIGMELSPLRWRGAKIGNAAEESTGVIPWGKKLSNVGIYVGQRGRMPAVLESLLISHPDIEEFITSKLEKGELENCNISVQIPDDFMDCLKNNKSWKLCFSTHRETFEKEVDPSYLVDLIANTAAQSAEPGVQFIDLMRRGSMVNAIYESTGDERFRVISSNACQPDFATVLTPQGIRRFGDVSIGDTIWSGNVWTTISDKWCTGVRDVYRFFTNAGCFVGTEDHLVCERGKKVEVDFARGIDSSCGEFDLSSDIIPQTVMDGLIIGDGSVHKMSNNKVYLNIGENDHSYFDSEVKNLIKSRNSISDRGYSWDVGTTIAPEEIPHTYDRTVPDRFYFGDYSTRISFLRGVFSANGYVVGGRVGLKQTSFYLIKQVQEMLSSVGIRSYITKNKSKKVKFDNGEYQTKKSYDIGIHTDKNKFYKLIGFIQPYKNKKLAELLNNQVGTRLPKITFDITSKEYLGKYYTYEITVDDEDHTYWTGGCLVSNCSEKPLPPYGVCNLGSINMEKFSTDPDQYKQELSQIAPYLVRFLDDVVSYELEFNKSPLEAQKWILEQTREIGLGVTNLHGWLLKQDIQYDSDEAIELVEDFFKTYAFCIFRASVELGRERGPAPALERVSSTKNLYENSTYFKNIVDEFYGGDYTKVGSLRNLAHMSNAPTGSLSNTFSTPCIASGVEPIIGPWYWRKTRAVTKGTYEYYFVIPERVKEYVLKQIPNDSEDYQKLYDFPGSVKDDDGKIGKEFVELIQSYVSDEFFKPAHQIDYYKKIDLMSRLYKWMDAAISCTFNLPPSATKDDVQDIYLYAYDKGVRAVSVYVEGSREGILIFDDPVTHKNKQAKQNLLCLNRPEDIIYHCAPKRPESLECDIHHCTVKGEKWLVLVGMFNGKPYEVFCGTQEDLYLPRSITTGTITKEKSQYNLVIQNKRTNVKYENIADILMTAEQKALTRMLSLSLRHGVPLEFITKQLRKSKNDITDFASVVSRVLGRYETQSLEEGEQCPSCGEPMVKQEGCIQCINQECGYSRCS